MIGAPTRSHEPRMRDPACETRMRHGDASEHRGQFALFTRIYWDHRDFFMCVGVRGQHLLLLSGSAPCSVVCTLGGSRRAHRCTHTARGVNRLLCERGPALDLLYSRLDQTQPAFLFCLILVLNLVSSFCVRLMMRTDEVLFL